MNEQIFAGLILFALASLVGWCFIGIGLKGRRNRHRREELERARATGIVVELIRQESTVRRGRVVFWRPVVECVIDGRTLRLESDTGYWENQVALREEVEILYDPSDPSRFHLVKLQEHERRSEGLMIFSGVFWVAIAAVIAWIGSKSI